MRLVLSFASILLPRFGTLNFRFGLGASCLSAQQSHLYSSTSQGPLTQYKEMIVQGTLQYDPNQEQVARELENLLWKMEQYEKDMEEYHESLAKWEKIKEDERRKLLMDEAESKQHGLMWNTKAVKNSSRFFARLMPRKYRKKAEPRVGNWVSYLNREKKLDPLVGQRPIAPPAPTGLYLFGSVGSGKSMLMDMFYRATNGIVKHRRRFHFHEAILKIHAQMHEMWKDKVQENSLTSGISTWIMNLPFDAKVKEWLLAQERYEHELHSQNILPAVADIFLVDRQLNKGGASILCFDEIQTVDVFAVVALSGILGRLLSTGTILVATSNRAPADLNQDGLQHDIFHEFVSKLGKHCRSVHIGSKIDYRRLIAQRTPNQVQYFWPRDDISVKKFEDMWTKIINHEGGPVVSNMIPVMFGREMIVPNSCKGVARLSFEYLCGRPVGAADYIALAKNYHTIFIFGIPVMSMRIRDKARRFITLIDELYNHHCRLFCLAEAPVDELFQGTEEGTLFDLESFQFETETDSGKLRRNVLAEGNVRSADASTAVVRFLSSQEEMFAFRRAASRLIEMQTSVYVDGVRHLHPHFQRN